MGVDKNHAVSAVRRHFLAVDDERKMNGMRDVGVHDDSLVERPVVGLRSVRTFHRDIEGHASFDRKVAIGNLACEIARALITEFRQESHVAGVDTEKGNVQSARTRRSDQERAVAADREDHIDIATRSVVDDIDAAFLECICEAYGARHRVGPVTVTNHQDTSHREPPAGPASTARRM